MKKEIIYSVLIIGLAVMGYFTWFIFVEMSLYQLKIPSMIKVVNRNPDKIVTPNLIYAIAIGIIPLLFIIVKRFATLKSINQRVITVMAIVIGGFLCWQIRLFQLKEVLRSSPEFRIRERGTTIDHFNFEIFYLERYLFLGFIIGGGISLYFFNKRNKQY